jgi:hypothetical protein
VLELVLVQVLEEILLLLVVVMVVVVVEAVVLVLLVLVLVLLMVLLLLVMVVLMLLMVLVPGQRGMLTSVRVLLASILALVQVLLLLVLLQVVQVLQLVVVVVLLLPGIISVTGTSPAYCHYVSAHGVLWIDYGHRCSPTVHLSVPGGFWHFGLLLRPLLHAVASCACSVAWHVLRRFAPYY